MRLFSLFLFSPLMLTVFAFAEERIVDAQPELTLQQREAICSAASRAAADAAADFANGYDYELLVRFQSADVVCQTKFRRETSKEE